MLCRVGPLRVAMVVRQPASCSKCLQKYLAASVLFVSIDTIKLSSMVTSDATTMRYSANNSTANPDAVVMYVDMNSFFASCEQQLNPDLRGKAIGVTAGSKNYAVIIAP